MKHNSLFTKNGYLAYDISFGYADNLPGDIRSQFEKSYPAYKITRAVKVIQSDRQIWVVNLESMNNYLVVRQEDGELEEVQRMDKS